MSRLYKNTSTINGTGLFTNEPLRKNQHVAFIDGPIVHLPKISPSISKKMLNWIGVSRCSWINTNQSLFRFINHSCSPNVAQISKRKVIALCDIPANTELCIDYSFTEAEEGWSISPCVCGAKNCRTTIGPIMNLPRRTFEKNKSHIPKVFQHIYEQAQSHK